MRKSLDKFLFYVVGVPIVIVWGLWLVVTGKTKVDWKREFYKQLPFIFWYLLGFCTVKIIKVVSYYYGL
jgi:hypothetical protein